MAYPSKPNDYLAKWREAERILAIREFTSTLPIPNNIISHPPEEAGHTFPVSWICPTCSSRFFFVVKKTSTPTHIELNA